MSTDSRIPENEHTPPEDPGRRVVDALRKIEESPWPIHGELLRDFVDAMDEMPARSRREPLPKVRPSRHRRAEPEESARDEPTTPLDGP